jgi:hypothetical protein
MLALAAPAGGDSSAVVQPRLSPKPTHIKGEYSPRLGFLGPAVTKQSESVASTRVELEASRFPLPPTNAEAEWMSLGPPSPWNPDTASFQSLQVDYATHHRLRVTYGSCERSSWLVIDDIVTGRADSRRVSASYALGSFGGLWDAMRGVRRVLGSDPPDPPIAWRSPNSFAWIMRADTLVVEQVAGPVLQLTLKARVR